MISRLTAAGSSIEVVDDTSFWASIEQFDSGPVLHVSTGVEATINRLWQEVTKNMLVRRKFTHTAVFDLNTFIHLSLEFLVCHELSHFDLGHFELADKFGVAQRSRQVVHTIDVVRYDLRHLAALCLEMQADHEATDTLLGAYSAEGWREVREKVLAISGMMMLIEREEAKLDFDEKTHPKAATRIFQLLCHVAEMPLIDAHLQLDASLLPQADEIERFGKEVTLPCYFDAVYLAEVAGAKSIEADLGSPVDFFADMAIVKLGDPSRYSDLKTNGAKEWAQLWECNEKLKPTMQAFA
ncbi:hypothetical protein [Tritonibacter mobilis]|uniref:hypothetical protein n=1 Tax=Tritonibacter mobilis TaxID=379347 RepID=UPI0010423447|nr:hypothetical protein [Tritonibacter mobilis]